LQSQSEIHVLESQLQDSRFNLTLLSHAESASDAHSDNNIKEELAWYEEHLKQKE
jgi:hypothetical protein